MERILERIADTLRKTQRSKVAELIIGFDKTIVETKPDNGQLLAAVLMIAATVIYSMPDESSLVFGSLDRAITEITPLLSQASRDLKQEATAKTH